MKNPNNPEVTAKALAKERAARKARRDAARKAASKTESPKRVGSKRPPMPPKLKK